MYIPLLRVHQGWEDEIFWFSTCISLLQHHNAVPSVLADFPGTQSPLSFYGPTLFWMGAAALHLFGATERVWRTFTFAGNVALLAVVALLFHRLRRSWFLVSAAVFLYSLSLTITLGFSLPGRVDAWTLALIVSAFVVVARTDGAASTSEHVTRFSAVGMLFAAAASTTPRCWPLLLLLFCGLPLLDRAHWLRAQIVVALSGLATLTLLLLPLHTTPLAHLRFVQQASSHDKINISPLMGGAWRFGHSQTQLLYALALVAINAILYLPQWRKVDSFTRWLVCAGVCNLAAMLLLVAGALNAPTYWAFPLEIGALLGCLQPLTSRRLKLATGLGLALAVLLAMVRLAREVPAFAQWRRRDPDVRARIFGRTIPAGSIVYGPVGQYFYPVLQNGSEYRYVVERTTGGLLSAAGELDRPSSLIAACQHPAYLAWPVDEPGQPLPERSNISLRPLAQHLEPAHRESKLEQLTLRFPAGRPEPDVEDFTIYRLLPDPQFCS